jgi:Reverse transcriptase (RNA-dependent DNA polymerase)
VDGSINKYKARLVARGFTQIYGVDYFDTFSPVAKLASIRTILAIATRLDWDVDTFDFNSAFLNGELGDDEEIYMQEPPGFEEGSIYVKRLRKSLYGLKQAGRRWYDMLAHALSDLGLRVTQANPGVFQAQVKDDVLILAVHVNDCIITSSSSELMQRYKKALNAWYALTDLGPIHWLLGIWITQDRATRTISLCQSTYIESIVARYGLADAKAQNSPMIPNVSYSKDDSPMDEAAAARMRKTPYREAIGSLMYAAVATRPDIAFAVSMLSQFLDNPGELHWDTVKHVLRYLSGMRHHELTYGSEQHDLLGYTDADGASQPHHHVISGYVFLIDGGAISWRSRKQEIVTLSTVEAEYVAATHAAKEAAWLRRLKGELLTPLVNPIMIYCDNQAALKLATDDNYRARTKHIDIRYHYIRQVINAGEISITYCPTDDMTADILTKALLAWKIARHIAGLGITQGPTALMGECWEILNRRGERLTAENGVQRARTLRQDAPTPMAP